MSFADNSITTLDAGRIRVLVVDDSAFMRSALARMIASDAEMEVVGTACNGAEALDRIVSLDPDVVTLDIEMPVLNGLEALRQIMTHFPRPTIMVSSATEFGTEAATVLALGAGAFDYIPKRLSGTSLDIDHLRNDLITKIHAAAGFRRLAPGKFPGKAAQSAEPQQEIVPESPQVVAVGSSTGGPKALQEILPQFPHDFPIPILIVQHMPPGFTGPLAHRLNTLCSIRVCEAREHDLLQPGTAYIAPAGLHMTVERDAHSDVGVHLGAHPANALHIPSVDVMMKSVSDVFGSQSIGVILSGMGDDGMQGMRAIYEAGGFTLGQDESTCTVYGMPRACADTGILRRVAALSQIPLHVLQVIRYQKRA